MTQQRAAQDSLKNIDNESDAPNTDQINEDWYSDDEGGNLTIVDSSKDEIEPIEKTQNLVIKEEFQPATSVSNIPQPAAIVDKLGDLNKIDISAEVSKLLSTLKAQSSATNKTQANSNQDASKAKSAQDPKTNSETSSSPRQSPEIVIYCKINASFHNFWRSSSLRHPCPTYPSRPLLWTN
ncbi:uncharacterized protein [Temnothorax nylanderi]|uniref:uncharacterized protein n=1 Tax=Temnothorax nylanderi TaxID=102681 RepID=UPI003A8C0A4D